MIVHGEIRILGFDFTETTYANKTPPEGMELEKEPMEPSPPAKVKILLMEGTSQCHINRR